MSSRSSPRRTPCAWASTAAVALGLAEQFARNAPLALAAVKNLVRAADGVPEADLFAVQREELGMVAASADAREGMTAFAERRAPRWTGK
ncbi:enoyl-CoA hydratase-related protein [Streptomyces sp. NPDC057950]|uniref:enoyl-CoA hydratase-related protein n=1 Tax=Streptomyces sp. NPDC057950 TaxID=3346288 RepID=UPI0036E065E7